jgi:hypothetical protein
MAECQIAEFFLNGLSPHVTFDDLQKKKMPSTPSKTNCQANYFQSKVVPTEFNYRSEKKASIRQKKNKAVCKICKVPPIFTYICTFGFGFGIRPKARCFSGQIFGFGLK